MFLCFPKGGRAWNRRTQATLIILFQIKGSLGVNILSAVVGGVGIILSTVGLTMVHELEKSCLILVSVSELILFSEVIFLLFKYTLV